ncbi:isochorismatase family protein [Mycolicibacterium hodleri]|uniref:Isochorismatase family protein n=1 Tax=Mycolicibacterium hodleri TaxID=49897 RepID=A0A502DLA7_9MYCO|nr:isochorismatase family protein [Mycolicibacterium hodleri]TPG25572.1 isochorismatase family protein [Mycolicibacterium hodleri]
MLSVNAETTALIVIDRQDGILSPEPVPFGRKQVVDRAAQLGRAFADAGCLTVLTATDFADGYADAPRGEADEPWALPEKGLPPGFATLVPEIDSLPAAVRITKRQMSAFFGTELLRRRRCDTVVICGVATNLGVEATARGAFDLDYHVVIAADACASVAPGLHDFAVRNILPRIARVRETTDILEAIGTPFPVKQPQAAPARSERMK